jgi:hypothetical protein
MGDPGQVRSHQEKNSVGVSDHSLLTGGMGQETATIGQKIAVAGYEIGGGQSELAIECGGGVGSGGGDEDIQTPGESLGVARMVLGLDHALATGENQTGHARPGRQ